MSKYADLMDAVQRDRRVATLLRAMDTPEIVEYVISLEDHINSLEEEIVDLMGVE